MESYSYDTLTSIRNAHFRHAVKAEIERCRKAGKPIDDTSAIHKVLHSSANGYYVGMEHARHMVPQALKGRLPKRLSPLRRRMWNEIASKARDYRMRKGGSMMQAICHVLSGSTASRYFMAESTALKIWTSNH